MSKSVTKEQIQLKKCRRLKDKNLHQHLLYRFLNQYGYDKGEITAGEAAKLLKGDNYE